MKTTLPFSNWSLKKALDTEPDNFIKARIRILFTIILFSLLKVIIGISLGAVHHQWLQVSRAAVALVVYLCIAKVLLSMPSRLKALAHIMLIMGVVFICTNIFIYAHKVNLITVQFVFMIMLSSFYTLGARWGITYSVIGILPVMLFLVAFGSADISFISAPQEFASPGYEIIVILNFLTIVVAHYLFYAAFHLNIKEKELLNEELRLSVAEARQLAQSKSDFLSTISHELRTPLNSVVGMAELLQDDKPGLHQKENLKILQLSALDLLSLINNVLDFNKLDSDKLVLETIPFQLHEFMRNICAGFRKKAADKQLDFVLSIDEQLSNINVVSDPTRLSQLIYNLVSNAIKFTEQGSVTVQLTCTNKTADRADVLFSVTDTGIGIPAERQHTIFDVFTQADSHTTRRYGGSGLGLAIVKQVLALFNSTVHLESAPAKGSRFFFTISFATTPAVSTPVKTQQVAAADYSKIKILVAEDTNFNRVIIKKQMSTLDVTPDIVENGQQAYEALMAGDYDAVLIDLHMPVLDGYETAAKIRAMAHAEKANIYMVAFTASVTEQQKIMDAGFNDYLYKPVNMQDLRDQLAKIALRGPITVSL